MSRAAKTSSFLSVLDHVGLAKSLQFSSGLLSVPRVGRGFGMGIFFSLFW